MKTKKILKAAAKWEKSNLTDNERMLVNSTDMDLVRFNAGARWMEKKILKKAGIKKKISDAESLENQKKALEKSAEKMADYYKDPTQWLPLEIDNLPGDILTGYYEFKEGSYCRFPDPLIDSKLVQILDWCLKRYKGDDSIHSFYYRPIQKEPTPEEKAEIIAEHMKPTPSEAIEDLKRAFFEAFEETKLCKVIMEKLKERTK